MLARLIHVPRSSRFLSACGGGIARAVAACALIVTVLTGCSDPNRPKEYEVQGVVKELKPDGKTAVIQHEKIPGYMEAMTMSFEVKDPVELKSVKAGDGVSFRMLVTEKDGWIDRVKVVSNAPVAAAMEPEPTPSFTVLPNVPELKVGDVLPDYTYTNELGKVVKLSDFRGKSLALTFIFTRCPFPTFCPRMTDHFKSVQQALQADGSAPKNWQLLSVSFDPAFDTPGTLRAYGKSKGYDPERWSLVSGDMTQIASLAQHFGLYFARNANPAGQNHNLRTVVIDPTGKVQSIFVGNDWTPEELIQEIVAAANKG